MWFFKKKLLTVHICCFPESCCQGEKWSSWSCQTLHLVALCLFIGSKSPRIVWSGIILIITLCLPKCCQSDDKNLLFVLFYPRFALHFFSLSLAQPLIKLAHWRPRKDLVTSNALQHQQTTNSCQTWRQKHPSQVSADPSKTWELQEHQLC